MAGPCGLEGHRGDDQARIGEIDAADLGAAQRDHAPPGVPEAGGDLARAALPGPPDRDGRELKIRVLNVSKKDLLKDLERAAEFDQSALFKKVYEEEYGTFGGEPFGVLVGDYEFSRHPQDMALLEKISQRGGRGARPVRRGGRARSCSTWTTSPSWPARATWPRSSRRVEYAKWRSFRESEDSRYVGLCLPHILMRLPYGRRPSPVEAFNFEEDVDGNDHKKYLWSNAAYAFAARLTDAFAKYGWCAAIRGVEGGGRSRACRSTPSRPTRATWR